MLRALTWTAAVLVVGGLLSLMAIAGFGPQHHTYVERKRYIMEIGASSADLDVERRVQRVLWPDVDGRYMALGLKKLPFDEATISFAGQVDWHFARDPHGLWRVTEPLQYAGQEVTPAIMQALLEDAGLSFRDEAGLAQLDLFCSVLRASLDGWLPHDLAIYGREFWDASGSDGYRIGRRAEHFLPERVSATFAGATTLFWITIWIAGLVFVLRKRAIRPLAASAPAGEG